LVLWEGLTFRPSGSFFFSDFHFSSLKFAAQGRAFVKSAFANCTSVFATALGGDMAAFPTIVLTCFHASATESRTLVESTFAGFTTVFAAAFRRLMSAGTTQCGAGHVGLFVE